MKDEKLDRRAFVRKVSTLGVAAGAAVVGLPKMVQASSHDLRTPFPFTATLSEMIGKHAVGITNPEILKLRKLDLMDGLTSGDYDNHHAFHDFTGTELNEMRSAMKSYSLDLGGTTSASLVPNSMQGIKESSANTEITACCCCTPCCCAAAPIAPFKEIA